MRLYDSDDDITPAEARLANDAVFGAWIIPTIP
jgi:hypothetical protein